MFGYPCNQLLLNNPLLDDQPGYEVNHDPRQLFRWKHDPSKYNDKPTMGQTGMKYFHPEFTVSLFLSFSSS